ncbi:MAG TPA: iron donor protein CyaY [Polyangiaceae bacterium]|jgi:CyaY protein
MSERIDENVFDKLADRTLGALEVALNEVDGLEADLESGILTIEFPDGSRFVVNSHRAARQIWMAAAAQAWHFDANPEGSRWTASKTHEELWSCLKGQVERKLGHPIELKTA